MIISINFALLTFFSFLSNFLKHFRRYENLFIFFFFWKAIQIAGSAQKKKKKKKKKKKTRSVGLAETQVFFRP